MFKYVSKQQHVLAAPFNPEQGMIPSGVKLQDVEVVSEDDGKPTVIGVYPSGRFPGEEISLNPGEWLVVQDGIAVAMTKQHFVEMFEQVIDRPDLGSAPRGYSITMGSAFQLHNKIASFLRTAKTVAIPSNIVYALNKNKTAVEGFAQAALQSYMSAIASQANVEQVDLGDSDPKTAYNMLSESGRQAVDTLTSRFNSQTVKATLYAITISTNHPEFAISQQDFEPLYEIVNIVSRAMGIHDGLYDSISPN